jgi:molybdenum cofactor cytidylyltransferase
MPIMPDVAAIILAAGKSSRFRGGDPNAKTKAIALLDGAPMVRHVAQAAFDAGLKPLVLVTGFNADEVSAAAQALPDLQLVHNADYETGLASSLRTGVAALPASAAGAIVLLADMPRVRAQTIRRLVETFLANPGAAAVVPVHAGQWGNPILLGAKLFADVALLQGDSGARKLLANRADVALMECADEAVSVDVDTLDDLLKLDRLRE